MLLSRPAQLPAEFSRANPSPSGEGGGEEVRGFVSFTAAWHTCDCSAQSAHCQKCSEGGKCGGGERCSGGKDGSSVLSAIPPESTQLAVPRKVTRVASQHTYIHTHAYTHLHHTYRHTHDGPVIPHRGTNRQQTGHTLTPLHPHPHPYTSHTHPYTHTPALTISTVGSPSSPQRSCKRCNASRASSMHPWNAHIYVPVINGSNREGASGTRGLAESDMN